MYLDLMERVLTNTIYPEAEGDAEVILKARQEGGDWPKYAHTMIGLKRLRNVRECAQRVIVDQVPGDFIEAGVWRGGAAIMIRAVIQACGVWDRRVWVADSFEGLPKPNVALYPVDSTLGEMHTHDFLRVSVAQVQENFRKYGLLDERVVFVRAGSGRRCRR